MARLKAASAKLLTAIAAQSVEGAQPGYTFSTKEAAADLTAAKLVEFNEEIANPTNPAEVAFRTTEAGNAEAAKLAAKAETAKANAPVSTFAVEMGAPPPAGGRGGRGGNVYPFETMPDPIFDAAGTLVQSPSFFIEATEAKPKPAKSMASTVSSASKRLAPKKFLARSVEEQRPNPADNGATQITVKGARVYRVA